MVEDEAFLGAAIFCTRSEPELMAVLSALQERICLH